MPPSPQVTKLPRLPDTEIRAIKFNPPLFIDAKNETSIDLVSEKCWTVHVDFDKRIVWVYKRNSQGYTAVSFAPFEAMTSVAYKTQGEPRADAPTLPAASEVS